MSNALKCTETLTSDISSTFVFSFDSNSELSSRRNHMNSYEYAVQYLPNPSYAVSVQKMDQLVRYREHTYHWMVKVMVFAVFYVDMQSTQLLFECCLLWDELL